MKLAWFVAFLAAWAAAGACPAQAQSAAAAETARAGLLFEATKGDRRIALFGTIHVVPGVAEPLDAVVRARMARAKAIAVEADTRDISRVVPLLDRYAKVPAGAASIDATLDPALRKRIDAGFARVGLSSQLATTFRPWMLAVLLTVAEAARAGYQTDVPVDTLVIAQADRRGVPLIELEGAEAQFAQLASGSDDTDTRDLLEVLDALDRGEVARDIRAVVQAWCASDEGHLTTLREAMRTSEHASERRAYAQLFAQRDASMADSIDRLSEARTPVFVAIGALHLVGSGSVIDELRRRGYAVRRL